MKKVYAQIDGQGVVTAVSELAGAVIAPNMIELPEYDTSLLGKRYENGAFVAQPPVQRSTLSRLAFRNRFTPAEKAALYTAAEGNVQIRIYLDDVNAASYIDLTRPDTIAGVLALEAAGIIAPGRGTAILTAPVSAEEEWRGG